MNQIRANQVTPSVRALFRTDEPQAPRCFAVLDGIKRAGKIICDDPNTPTWGVVQEVTDGGIYLGGEIDAPQLAEVLDLLRQEGEVLVGLWLDDPRQSLLPPDPYYDGRTLEFYERPLGQGLDQYLNPLPEGFTLHRLDRDLIMRTEWGPDDVQAMGGIEAWEQNCFGYCLMRGDELLCESTVGPPSLGLYEPGVITQEAHRGKGYATMTAARLVQEIESMGYQSYWNCAKQNVPSAKVARKLGYQVEKEYRLLAWSQL